MNNITIDYSVFDNDENLKVFHELYQKEIGAQPQTLYRENLVEFEAFKERLNNYKTPNPYIITGNNSNYYYNMTIRFIDEKDILYKYFQYYNNFFNFNLHYYINYNNVNTNYVYGFYNNNYYYGEDYIFFVLNYSILSYDKKNWVQHCENVKNTERFIKKNNLRCSKSIKNMFLDVEVLSEIYDSYAYDSLKTIEDIEKFEKFLEKNVLKYIII